MSKSTKDTFTISLPLLFPEQVSLWDFVAFVKEFTLAMEDESDETLSRSGTSEGPPPPISIIGVNRGSTGYAFASAGPAVTIVRRMLEAIAHPSGGWAELKEPTRVRLRKSFDRLEQCGSSVELSGALLGERVIRYTPPLALREIPIKVSGGTDITVKVLSVSCTSSRRAYVAPLNGEPPFYTKVRTTELLGRLGARVEGRVTLRGTAHWELPDWHITSFDATDVIDYPTKSPAEVFDALSSLLGSKSDGLYQQYTSDRAASEELK